jgi:putative ABC transport system substrate-binding protein
MRSKHSLVVPTTKDEGLFRPRISTRRQILTAAASVAMTGWVSAAQRPYRLAYLVPASRAANELNQRALFGALAELGYREGHNLEVERRFAEGRIDRLSALAAELVALKPDVLFTGGSQATLAASTSTTTVPIVFVAVSDPVAIRIVKSLRRPGTNATGLSNQAEEFQIKTLQLLKEVFPSASRVALLHDPTNLPLVRTLPTLKQAAATLALNLRMIEARSPEDLVPAFELLKSERPDVLYVLAAAFFVSQRGRIVELVNAQRQVTVYGQNEFADAGGLMAYSFNTIEQYRASATFIDKILRGANPAELPVEQPTRFDLVLNLRTATAQGVRFPHAVLLRADRVIE